ncbi:protein FAR-RED IMPAIRED RESPONSE 1-like [Arachis stenosperma]|uniref:protein FAR-RED IMPAIRED RESPONSE 1-like n=1 Tax=Arachis stenosperma TaxID=217475 RepID=UPI0025AC1A6D|nr:protein FAR-RED IMPAIRED RESPONSE 1-like [Arachis stenosperma]
MLLKLEVKIWILVTSYVKKIGFATKIRTETCDKITKEAINQAIHYNRDGFRGSHVKAPTQKNTISAVGCKVRIYVKFDREKQEWIFFKVELRHSHPCSAKKAVHYHEYREMTVHAKCVIEDNDEGDDELLHVNEGHQPKLLYVVNLDEECKFRSAVWVDARCKTAYEYYGDVVSFDSTYSTNRHRLPFASSVGVNHHNKSTLLGCALLGNEETPIMNGFSPNG